MVEIPPQGHVSTLQHRCTSTDDTDESGTEEEVTRENIRDHLEEV